MEIIKVENPNALKPEKVELRRPTVKDSIYAQRVSGKDQGMKFCAALVSACAKFDGKTLPAEEIEKMEDTDFLELLRALGFKPSSAAKESLPLPEEQGSDSTK